jgi:hypothetical protein
VTRAVEPVAVSRPLVVSAAAALLLAFSLSGCSAAAPTPHSTTYGGVPDYLRNISAAAGDRVLTGTAARPALTVEGDAVDVRLAGGTARATVVGPQVPGEGLPHQTSSTACTWTVTLTGVSGNVAVAASDFTSLDHFGNVYRPTVLAGSVVTGAALAESGPSSSGPSPSGTSPSGVAAGDVLPATLGTGQTVTFQLRAFMRVGEGLMRWAPGGAKVASWDFQVETD